MSELTRATLRSPVEPLRSGGSSGSDMASTIDDPLAAPAGWHAARGGTGRVCELARGMPGATPREVPTPPRPSLAPPPDAA